MGKIINDEQPLVSVIVPFYNSEKYLKRCIDSILSQSYNNIELILADDESSDGSAETAQQCAVLDSRVMVLSLAHGGVSAARNEGLKKSSADYVMFVDSDDWMSPYAIEHMMAAIKETKADIVTCGIERAEEQEDCRKSTVPTYTIYRKDDYLRIFFRINSNEWVHYPVAKLYRKAILPQPLYPEDIKVGEDVLGTYLAVSAGEKIARINETGYYYFINPEGATGSFNKETFDLLVVWDQVEEASRGKEPDHSYAVLNRKRANFTLLLRLVTEVPAGIRKREYKAQEEKLRKDLKECEKDLLSAPIVRSRKALIFLLCHFYPVFSFFGNISAGIFARKNTNFTVIGRRDLS